MLSHLDERFPLDPHPTWDAMRAADPVTFVPEVGAWVVTGYEAGREMLLDPRLSPSRRFWKHYQPPEPGAPLTPRQRFEQVGLFNATPEGHTRLRRLLSHAFTPRGVEQQAAFVDDLVGSILDRWSPGDEVDLVNGLFREIPPLVIANLLGFPPSYRDTFVSAAAALVLTIETDLDDDAVRRMDEAIDTIERLVEATAEERRAEPRDDLLTRLLEAEAEGDRLDHIELVSLVQGLIVAGSGTTAELMSAGTVALLEDREQLDLLVAEPERMGAAVEEMVRQTTRGFGLPRFAAAATELGGHAIAPGDLLFVVVPAVNHDPDQFEDPHRFDIRRDASGHLGFGLGAHYCLGAALARLETGHTLGALLRRFPHLELAGEPQLRTSMLFRDLVSVPVRL